jgi:hypothetical protein
MAAPPYALEFSAMAVGEVLGAMAARAEGSGWLNFEPVVVDEAEDRPRPRGSGAGLLFGALFAARGPMVPLCSWVPMPTDRLPHVELGVQHARGVRAAEQLAEAGNAVPEQWRVLGDHPKRGLVVAVPVDADHEDVLQWLLRAGTVLSAAPTTGNWRAGVFSR